MENVRNIPPLDIKGARIVKRNFAGRREGHNNVVMNREGNRYFTIRIDDPELAKSLLADG